MLSNSDKVYMSEHLNFWNKLSNSQQVDIENCAFVANYEKGKSLYSTNNECLGLVLIKSGQLRAFITSNDGKEISLFRLLSLDVCILSASCMIKNINFDLNIQIEKDSKVYVIPIQCFNKISEENTFVKNFALELISARFSEVMWVFDQYVFGSAAGRLANFLITQSQLEQNDTLNVTHEFIANDIGTAREVVTRLLKHFATDKMVTLSRGTIKIEDKKALNKLC